MLQGLYLNTAMVTIVTGDVVLGHTNLENLLDKHNVHFGHNGCKPKHLQMLLGTLQVVKFHG